jgi:hypothetical protein
MHPFVSNLLIALGSTFGFVLALALFMTVAPRRVQDAIARAPLLDVAVALMTWVPWVACGIWLGWAGLLGSVLGGPPALMAWSFIHEQMNREAMRGPRIVKFVNRTVGRWQNHLALWVTAIALPVFWGIRFAEIFVYPLLPLLLNFPKYKQSEWINVTRQKFSGLVGHDLIWCLYCDWMTGRLQPRGRDAAERRELLVPDPLLRRQEVRPLQSRVPRHRQRLGPRRRHDGRGRSGDGKGIR